MLIQPMVSSICVTVDNILKANFFEASVVCDSYNWNPLKTDTDSPYSCIKKLLSTFFTLRERAWKAYLRRSRREITTRCSITYHLVLIHVCLLEDCIVLSSGIESLRGT